MKHKHCSCAFCKELVRRLLEDLKLSYSKLNPIERKAVKETLAG